MSFLISSRVELGKPHRLNEEKAMPNQDRTRSQTQQQGKRQPPPASGDGKSEQDQRDLSSQRQSQSSSDEDIESGEGVEIGDPIPEDNRTIRARGETGEDEDLPEDTGNIEGSSSERH
jgi:hypothetical protein